MLRYGLDMGLQSVEEINPGEGGNRWRHLQVGGRSLEDFRPIVQLEDQIKDWQHFSLDVVDRQTVLDEEARHAVVRHHGEDVC